MLRDMLNEAGDMLRDMLNGVWDGGVGGAKGSAKSVVGGGMMRDMLNEVGICQGIR